MRATPVWYNVGDDEHGEGCEMPQQENGVVVLTEDEYRVLGEADFGMPGLRAAESLGPFMELQASGPIITVHDALVEPHLGIGHHPHRMNERLFYILRGSLDHDDALNGITGHMGPGDLGRLTEGRRGMYHKEWNNSDEQTRAYILVYATDPVPQRASFAALRDADAQRYEEAPGVRAKELVGPKSDLELHGDIRFYADSSFEEGAEIEVPLGEDDAALLFPLEGEFIVGDVKLTERQTLFARPGQTLSVRAASPGRLLRVIHGAGDGLVYGTPYR